MNRVRTSWSRLSACALTLVLLSAVTVAHAHLMPAQRGTLNIVDDGAFMVLSLPVSAFSDVDENDDGQWSTAEFNTHRAGITQAVKEGVALSDGQGQRPLQGIMLSPVLTENEPT